MKCYTPICFVQITIIEHRHSSHILANLLMLCKRVEGAGYMVFNTTFSNISVISWQSVPGENIRPAASHRQTLSHNVVSSTSRHERGSNSQLLW
jgi:hypothetical protein